MIDRRSMRMCTDPIMNQENMAAPDKPSERQQFPVFEFLLHGCHLGIVDDDVRFNSGVVLKELRQKIVLEYFEFQADHSAEMQWSQRELCLSDLFSDDERLYNHVYQAAPSSISTINL
ncbi:unnamed protein product [Trichobilharzia regenti]|nr:unnamed protein product [Trichobilharzia regenti]